MNTDRKSQEREWQGRLSVYRDALNNGDEAAARTIRGEAEQLARTLDRWSPQDMGLDSILTGVIDIQRWIAACRRHGWQDRPAGGAA